MQQIPKLEKLKFWAQLFVDGEHGSAMQEWRNDEYGLTVVASRTDSNTEFTRRLLVDGLDGDFGSVEEANEAIAAAST